MGSARPGNASSGEGRVSFLPNPNSTITSDPIFLMNVFVFTLLNILALV
jgi:hypothetical protein